MARVTSTQKLPIVLICVPRKAPDDGDRDGDAGGCRDEVLNRQRRHLRKVAER